MKKRKSPISEITRSCIEISGRDEILTCGCKGLSFYSRDEVKIIVSEGEISIRGNNLSMRWAGDGCLLIEGEISAVEFA